MGVEVTSQSNSLHLSQQKYIQDLLHRTDKVDAKPVRTPGALRQQLSLIDGDPLLDASLYRSIVGALQYATITRPDLAFAVNNTPNHDPLEYS